MFIRFLFIQSASIRQRLCHTIEYHDGTHSSITCLFHKCNELEWPHFYFHCYRFSPKNSFYFEIPKSFFNWSCLSVNYWKLGPKTIKVLNSATGYQLTTKYQTNVNFKLNKLLWGLLEVHYKEVSGKGHLSRLLQQHYSGEVFI